MRKYLFLIILITLLLLSVGPVFSQSQDYDGPDDPAGDIAAEREGYMTGNRVLLYFQNNTELAYWTGAVGSQWSRWPNNLDGTRMLDGIALLISARVFIKDDLVAATVDTLPVTDPYQIATLSAQGKIDTLFFLQTSYREEMDRSPLGTTEWGLYPVFGYFNEDSEHPAMSNDSTSWPIGGWPASGISNKKWAGEWNGRFGRGVIYADLATFFVANDAQDLEYLGVEDFVKYYPRPGIKIGDKKSDVTTQYGKPWGGLGLRVEQRGFQWNNPQARDAIFWEYTIANISEYDIKDVCFGYWVDNGIGGEKDDELSHFHNILDMAYSWDEDETGYAGAVTGLMGFAYLESPGKPIDGIDNDLDGLVDEKRDNLAGNIIGATDNIVDLEAFLSFYHLNEEDLHEHFEGDEDQDWQDGDDFNNNGVYDAGENPGDDVGTDGVGPDDLNYIGPDLDGTECNHQPDYLGIGYCEPNFASTDVSESDMIGLTFFEMFPIPSHSTPGVTWFKYDSAMYNLTSKGTLEPFSGTATNLVECFASGPFKLDKGRTERISMSELHAYDALEGLTDENNYIAPALYKEKEIVQVIYERDYRFASPPIMPTLSATPGDGKVILTWDNTSDTKTRDPFLANVNDFEGYKIFRATDKYMQDAEVITDGYGTPMFKKPICQYDIKDGKTGFTDFGLVNGMGYNLGMDTGLKHYFVDENIQNGRTYYYAIVAYDYGAPDIGPGISPSENNIIIELDDSEEVNATSKNVQIVTPFQKAAGYIPDEIIMIETELLGSGAIAPQIMANGDLKSNHIYGVTFGIDTLDDVDDGQEMDLLYSNNSFKVHDLTEGKVVYEENPDKYYGTNLVYSDSTDSYSVNSAKDSVLTDIFDGMRLSLSFDFITAEYDYMNSAWLEGNSPIKILETPNTDYYPWEYDIIFGDPSDELYLGEGKVRRIYNENGERITKNILNDVPFPFTVKNKSFTDSTGQYLEMDIVALDMDEDGLFDPLVDRTYVGPHEGSWTKSIFAFDFEYAMGDAESLPEDGDVYHISFKRPFWVTDTLKYTVAVYDSLDEEKLKSTMKDIKVVPNPYTVTNMMESALANPFLNQKRELLFIHLPAKCTISIFTMSGILIDVLKVDNASDNGTAHWDMKTKENLEIAAGMYLYHVESDVTGEVKMGKFAVIK